MPGGLANVNACTAASIPQSICSTRYEHIRKPVRLNPWVQWMPEKRDWKCAPAKNRGSYKVELRLHRILGSIIFTDISWPVKRRHTAMFWVDNSRLVTMLLRNAHSTQHIRYGPHDSITLNKLRMKAEPTKIIIHVPWKLSALWKVYVMQLVLTITRKNRFLDSNRTYQQSQEVSV